MIVLDIEFAPENAGKSGYEWVTDLLPAILRGEIRGVEDFKDKKLWIIGKAKVKNHVLGLYKPIGVKQEIEGRNKLYVGKDLLNFPVDQTLNIENANKKGYRWIEDFVYDKSQKMERNIYEVMKSLIEDGFKIGKAGKPVGDLDQGWYAPLKKDI